MFGLPIWGNLKGILALKERSWGKTIKSGTCPKKGDFEPLFLDVNRGQN